MYFRQAIVVSVIPATETRQTKLKAHCEAGELVESYDSGGMKEQAADMARRLAQSFGWKGLYQGGGLPGEGGWVFTHVDDDFVSDHRTDKQLGFKGLIRVRSAVDADGRCHRCGQESERFGHSAACPERLATVDD